MWPFGRTPRLSQRVRESLIVIECCTENLPPLVAVTRQRALSIFRGLSTTSKDGFAESTATPPLGLDINDGQPMDLLASPPFAQEREASADRSQVYHPERENLESDSSRLQVSTERPVALMLSESETNLRSILAEQRQQLLSEVHSEILKQESRAEKAETDIRELQRQIQSTRMEFWPYLRGVTKRTSTTVRTIVSRRTQGELEKDQLINSQGKH